MVDYSTNEMKPGMKVMLDGDPASVIENDYVKPGKGQAFNRMKIRNLKTGRVIERTFKSGDSLPGADVVEMEMTFLYNDSEYWHFMGIENYEQYLITDAAVGDTKLWIKEQDVCTVTLWNNQAIAVMPPNFVILKIVETDPGVRGDTSGGGGKPAKLETGAVVRVPLFVGQDELIKVDTRTGEYSSRVKE